MSSDPSVIRVYKPYSNFWQNEFTSLKNQLTELSKSCKENDHKREAEIQYWKEEYFSLKSNKEQVDQNTMDKFQYSQDESESYRKNLLTLEESAKRDIKFCKMNVIPSKKNYWNQTKYLRKIFNA